MTTPVVHPKRPAATRNWLRDVPVAVWAYGPVRAIAFAAPSWSAGGQIGLGVIVVLALYIMMVRQSRRAWIALVVLDTISHLLLIFTWIDQGEVPALAIPIFAGASMAALLAHSTRHYVLDQDN